MPESNQHWNSQSYKEHAHFVPTLGTPIIKWLAPKPEEYILDLGCGDGTLTEKIASIGCTVVGVDSSPEFVSEACSRGIDARLMDGANLQFNEEFDGVFSNAALHWMKENHSVARGVWNALIPNGRFIGEFGGKGNIQTIVMVLYEVLEKYSINAHSLNPWYFPSVKEYQDMLESVGFEIIRIIQFERPTVLATGIQQWVKVFAQSFISDLPISDQIACINIIQNKLYPLLYKNNQWVADYVRLRFEARKI
ncbi:class I SAM-dependent methyltransferase [Candidatus Nitrosacidococcus sp. I8]|uniref:class I SAM-dependent methyltransferase n=1 Tax=Candidatus Nitrosacidococcus sp. I8 TaxID=2942908 RepID=UPI0022271FE3|nr:class I SAM-dependent methyltransferase [Candidatus Nitrosacidococcus sp. I8]CAH9018997.1 Trans-aconitate 2-methyltransferase [Candidatus Nitrosacidococcus sp. I8]